MNGSSTFYNSTFTLNRSFYVTHVSFPLFVTDTGCVALSLPYALLQNMLPITSRPFCQRCYRCLLQPRPFSRCRFTTRHIIAVLLFVSLALLWALSFISLSCTWVTICVSLLRISLIALTSSHCLSLSLDLSHSLSFLTLSGLDTILAPLIAVSCHSFARVSSRMGRHVCAPLALLPTCLSLSSGSQIVTSSHAYPL